MVPRRRHRLPLLVVSPDRDFARTVGEAVDGVTVEHETDPEAALRTLGSRPVAGAVLDADGVGRHAHALASAFLTQQPAGHVVVVASSDDPATLVRLAVRDPRVEVVFAPCPPEVLRASLFGKGETTGARRGKLRWLLQRA